MADRITERTESVGKPWREGDENISWDQICFVRALNDERSIQVSNGEIILPTISTLTKGNIPRYTSHWAINHLVGAHFMGSWSMSAIVIISPAEQLIDKNGLPENLTAVDTFWTKDMTVPKGSAVVCVGEISEELKDLDGIKLVKIPSGDEKIEKIKGNEKAIENHEFKTTEELNDLVGDKNIWKKELGEVLCGVVNKEMSELGYTVFDQEYGGIYMGERGLDNAILSLSERENIKSSNIHAHTLFGQLESDYFGFGPLGFLAKASSLTDLQKIAEKPEGKNNGVEYCLVRAEAILNDKNLKWTESEKKERLVFSAELYKILKNSLKELEKNKDLRYTCAIFLEDCPEVREIIKSWSEKDSVNLDSVLS